MTLTLNEVNYDVVGFDTYVDDYSKAAKPDFKNDGEQEILCELEGFYDANSLMDGEDISISMPDEKSIDGKMHVFRFGFTFEDGAGILNYYGCEEN